jgi:hypothetical protein
MQISQGRVFAGIISPLQKVHDPIGAGPGCCKAIDLASRKYFTRVFNKREDNFCPAMQSRQLAMAA